VRGEATNASHSGQRIPALDLERLVAQRLRDFFADPDAVFDALSPDRTDAPARKLALGAAAQIVRTVDQGGDDKTIAILRPLLQRVQVHADGIEIVLGARQVVEALIPEESGRDHGASAARPASSDPDADCAARIIRLTTVAKLKRTGKEVKFVIESDHHNHAPDASLVRLLARAHALNRRLVSSPGSTLEDVGAQERIGAPYAARLMRLNFLAPDIVVAILNGRQPTGLTTNKLMADTRLPLEWSAQRVALGFA
jgi:hypothetical protein